MLKKMRLPRVPLIFTLSAGVGLVTGIAAALLKRGIAALSGFLTSAFSATGANPWMLLLPFAGIILTALFCRYVLRADIAHGVRRLVADLRRRFYRLPASQMISYLIASTLTLGFGGSAGSEGPIASTGAAIGSNVGRRFGLSPSMMKVMVACGAGAGIAAIFRAPIGGAVFVFEVLQVGITTMSVLALLATCLVAALTAYVLGGCVIDLPFNQAVAPFHEFSWLWLIALGIFCGLYSEYYNCIMRLVERLLLSLGRPLRRVLAGAAIVGILVFLFPALYGEGYGVIGRIVNGDASSLLAGSPLALALAGRGVSAPWVLAIVAAAVMLVKCFATSATNSGGGVAGDFAPTLFAGAVVGLCFATFANNLFDAGISPSDFALYAMAAVMAGTIRAPLMAIFLTVEMTASYPYLLPLTIAAGISFGVVRIFHSRSFYYTRI